MTDAQLALLLKVAECAKHNMSRENLMVARQLADAINLVIRESLEPNRG